MAELYVICSLFVTYAHPAPFYFCSKAYDIPCLIVHEQKWNCQTRKHAPMRRAPE